MQMRLHRRLRDAERNRGLRHAADIDDRLQDPQFRRREFEGAINETGTRAAVEFRFPDEQGSYGRTALGRPLAQQRWQRDDLRDVIGTVTRYQRNFPTR